jgi:hypothetical protein
MLPHWDWYRVSGWQFQSSTDSLPCQSVWVQHPTAHDRILVQAPESTVQALQA